MAEADTLPKRVGNQCPMNGADNRRTAPPGGAFSPAVEQDGNGVWHVRSFAAARKLLRSDATRQAGFKAELIEKLPERGKTPILFLEGTVHHEQRRLTAPFFTPKTVSARYRDLMASLADEILGRFAASGRVDLSAIGMEMAVGIAAEVVGLTNSRTPGLDRRINAFFAGGLGDASTRLARWRQAIVAQAHLLRFYLLDVRPSIRARRKAPREDVISHLLNQGYRDSEILTECITYGAAGMVTTREFITVCAWHMLDDPALAAHYCAVDEPARHALLEEVLRLEPVVGTLFRRTTEEVSIDDGVPIPKGELVAVDLRAVNADEAVVGEDPLSVRADRCPAGRAGASVMGFGDGHHRCPGSFLAIQETDMFLMRLLAVPGLHLEKPPTVSWNDLVTGYELRTCILVCDPPSQAGATAPDTTAGGPSVSAQV
jgi:cytochrome P450